MFNKLYEKLKRFLQINWKFILSIIIIFGLFYIDLPYVIYAPGGTIDLENRVSINNEKTSSGKLSMAYVKMIKGNLPFLAASYIIKDWDLIKRSEITMDNESVDNMIKRDHLYLLESLSNATIVAYRKAEKDIKIKKKNFNVIYIDEKSETSLQLYDKLISVDDTMITSLEEYKNIVNSHEVGDTLNLKVIRDNKEKNVTIKVYENNNEKLTGLAILTTYDLETNPKIEIKSKQNESGSSGGLMLALSIYNKLTEKDITKGKNIVGTGTINENGQVGEIDGVKYKLLGANKNNADVFLCPKENYKEAKKIVNKYKLKIKLKSVSTFDEAINYLNSLK